MPESAPSAVTAAPAPPATTGSREKNARTSTSPSALACVPSGSPRSAGQRPRNHSQAAAANAASSTEGGTAVTADGRQGSATSNQRTHSRTHSSAAAAPERKEASGIGPQRLARGA